MQGKNYCSLTELWKCATLRHTLRHPLSHTFEIFAIHWFDDSVSVLLVFYFWEIFLKDFPWIIWIANRDLILVCVKIICRNSFSFFIMQSPKHISVMVQALRWSVEDICSAWQHALLALLNLTHASWSELQWINHYLYFDRHTDLYVSTVSPCINPASFAWLWWASPITPLTSETLQMKYFTITFFHIFCKLLSLTYKFWSWSSALLSTTTNCQMKLKIINVI